MVAEALVALAAGGWAPLSVLGLLVAPGLALVGLLPARAREDLVTALALAPALGFAASAAGLITVSSAGLPLDDVVVRLVPAAVVAAGIALPLREPRAGMSRREALVAAGLVGAVVAAVALQARVLAGPFVPGNDWAKYVLYAEEIRSHGALLIDNPFWMLGVPFREDPGTPAVYGAFLVMTGLPAPALVHGIWAFAVMSVLSVFGLVRALWGAAAGILAALLWAVLPMTQDIVAWHGLPNQAGLALLALVLLYAGTLLVERLSLAEVAGFGLALLALAATHRLSLLMGAGALAITAATAFVLGEGGRVARPLAGALLAAGLLGAGVLYDVVQRQRTFGGTLAYTDYLEAKFNEVATARDLTFVFVAAAAVAVVVAIARAGRDRPVIPLLAMLAFTLACAYAWVVQLPMAYVRMAYYLPLALVPLVAVALTRLPRAPHALAAGGALAAVIALLAWPAAPEVRRFYAFVGPASLQGLDAVAAELRPGEIVVTDRCWSFLATWLLRTPTLPALFAADIQPKAEVARAEQARSIVAGTPAGRALARRLGVRFVIADPTCPDPEGSALEPPRIGAPAFISERLVVLRI